MSYFSPSRREQFQKSKVTVVLMTSFSYSNGSGATLSLRNVELPAVSSSDKHRGPSFLRSKDIASLNSFDDQIDRSVRQIYDDVLGQIVDFFLSTPPQRQDVFRRKRSARQFRTLSFLCFDY
ncbi:hypothetical protein Y032_0003g1247 [Ancylostoma ceylanicum]|uniref:Uncharacterized protein n=1 Tax=Ancylostoma ceylanicum TaxID=53326 RepID=A0A016VWT9_9BILA|nr:hypothetical protein Y032_0003g1247 [Ancylostoma ceylanicum]